MFENPVIMMALPAALALASMLTGYVLCSWLNSRHTETLQDVSDQLASIKRAHRMAGGRETAEWQMEIDGLQAEISELRSMVNVHESEVELACETIDRLRFKLNSSPQPGHVSDKPEPTEEPVILAGKFHSPGDVMESNSGYGGTLIRDEKMGWVYSIPPMVTDNLRLISGIATVLESRLNDFGVYTFEQIMRWDDSNIDEFSNLLDTFKHRILRDDWVGQARYFYEKRKASKTAA